MCKTLHKVISPYGPHDKICNSKWFKKLFFMEVRFISDFIIMYLCIVFNVSKGGNHLGSFKDNNPLKENSIFLEPS